MVHLITLNDSPGCYKSSYKRDSEKRSHCYVNKAPKWLMSINKFLGNADTMQ